MNNLKPHIPLSTLAKAVADYDGRILNPKSEAGRAELLEIAADILENPMENAELLDIISRPNESSPAPSPAWSRPGEMTYLATVDITPELELLLDDIDDRRTHDLLGRELKSHSASEADVVVTQRNSRFVILASPDFLGFEQNEPARDFNRKAFQTGLSRAHRDLKKYWLAHTAMPTFEVTPGADSASPDRILWKVFKTIRAENFHEVTVKHEKKAYYMAVIGSGDDLFLKVTIDNKEVTRTKESLTNLKRFINTFVDSFSSEPEAGLLIADSLLEDFQVTAPFEQRHELEP